MKKLVVLFCLVSLSYLGRAQCGSFTMSIIYNNPTCYQFCDGSLSVQVQGQTGNVTFVITDDTGTPINVGGANTANSLCEGWYYVSATDEQPCTLEDSVFIDDPDQIDIQLSVQDVLCFGDATGSAVVDTILNAQGNYSQISYFWSPDPAGISGIGGDSSYTMTAGNYDLTVNDEFGCSQIIALQVSEPNELVFTQIGMEPCTDSTGGVVYAAAGGGTPDYDNLWWNINDSLFNQWSQTTVGGLQPDCYAIQVTDGNNCTLYDTLCMSCLSIEEQEIALEIYPNPSNGIINLTFEQSSPAILHIYNLSGALLMSETLINQQTINLQHLSSGTYLLQIKNESGIARKIVVIN